MIREDNILEFKRPAIDKGVQLEDGDEASDDEALDLDKLTKLLNFLTALRTGSNFNRPLDRNIELRRRGIEKSSDGWLFARVNRSSEFDWKSRASFYDAVIAELLRRKIIK